jgi:hypothetical protein
MNTIKRIQSSSRSYGRGRDSSYTPAKYGVFSQEGEQIGTILGSSVCYMETSNWELDKYDENGHLRSVKSFRSFKTAKSFAEDWS